MHTVHHSLRVRIFVLVKHHGIPSGFSPPFPVLNKKIHRYIPLFEAIGIFEQLCLSVISFPALDEAERPILHMRDRTGKFPVRSNHLVGSSGEHSIIVILGYRRVESRGTVRFVDIEFHRFRL